MLWTVSTVSDDVFCIGFFTQQSFGLCASHVEVSFAVSFAALHAGSNRGARLFAMIFANRTRLQKTLAAKDNPRDS